MPPKAKAMSLTICPNCHTIFNPEVNPVGWKLITIQRNVTLLETSVPPPAPYVSFGDNPLSADGVVTVALDVAADPKPTEVSVAVLPPGGLADADITPEAILGQAAYPQGSTPIADPNLTELAVHLTAKPVPGVYDLAAFGLYAD